MTEAEYLATYDRSHFPCFAVTADIVLLTIHEGRFSVLIVRRAGHPEKGKWALPGGFVDEDEDVDATAVRELAEETFKYGRVTCWSSKRS